MIFAFQINAIYMYIYIHILMSLLIETSARTIHILVIITFDLCNINSEFRNRTTALQRNRNIFSHSRARLVSSQFVMRAIICGVNKHLNVHVIFILSSRNFKLYFLPFFSRLYLIFSHIYGKFKAYHDDSQYTFFYVIE